MKKLVLLVSILLTSSAFGIADDYWCDVVGEKSDGAQVKYLTFSSRDCELQDAKEQAIRSCEWNKADYCGIPKCKRMSCRTKCNCS